MKILVKAKPNAKKESVKKTGDNSFEICVKEPPEKGRANAAIIKILAYHFDVSQSRVQIVIGHASRQKIVEIK